MTQATYQVIGWLLIAVGVVLSAYGGYVYLSGPRDVGVVRLDATFSSRGSTYELNTFSALPLEVIRVYGPVGDLPRVETDWKEGCFSGIYVVVSVDGTSFGPYCKEGLPVFGYLFGLPQFTARVYLEPGRHSIGIRAFYGRSPIGETSRTVVVPTYEGVKGGRS